MFVIVGVAGSGKSTLARLLRKHGYKVVELRDYVIDHDEYLAYDAVRKSLVIDPSVCPEGIIVSTFIPECAKYCILLEAPPEEIRRRLSRRGYDEEKIEENVESMEVLRVEAEETCEELLVIDGTKVTDELERVIAFLERFE